MLWALIEISLRINSQHILISLQMPWQKHMICKNIWYEYSWESPWRVVLMRTHNTCFLGEIKKISIIFFCGEKKIRFIWYHADKTFSFMVMYWYFYLTNKKKCLNYHLIWGAVHNQCLVSFVFIQNPVSPSVGKVMSRLSACGTRLLKDILNGVGHYHNSRYGFFSTENYRYFSYFCKRTYVMGTH